MATILKAKSKKNYLVRSQIIKALAHPTRLMFVEELSKGERCVCELTEMAGADISTVSKHLSILKNAGILRDQKRGQSVFYSLYTPCILGFLSCVEKVLEQRIKEQKELA